MRGISLVACVVAAAAAAVPQPTFRISTRLIEVTVVVQDDVPPPNVMPGFATTWAVALVGPSIEQ